MRKSTIERMTTASALQTVASLLARGGGESEGLVLLPVRLPFLSVFSFRWRTELTGDLVIGRVPQRRRAEPFRRVAEIPPRIQATARWAARSRTITKETLGPWLGWTLHSKWNLVVR